MTIQLQASLNTFIKDINRNEIFIKLESKIKNPASPLSRPRSETLLSAYISLTCGRFENFLQQSFYLAAEDLRSRIVNADDPRIHKVDRFYWQNLHGFVKWAANAKGIDRADMIGKIQGFSTAIANGRIYPESFQYTNANPDSNTLKEMFNRFGVEDCLSKLSKSYIDIRQRNFSPLLIDSTLSAFVKKRHEAAHHGRIPNMTRVDAQDYHVFILGLAGAIITVLSSHIASII